MSTFSYTTGIPAASHNPSSDQGPMQTNCNSIASLVNVDLYGFGTGNDGFHQQSTYVRQGGAKTSDATHSPLYAKLANGITELFLSRYYGAASTEVQMTSGAASLISAPTATNVGQSFIAGGFQVKFGYSGGGASGAVSYTNAFPTKTVIVLATPVNFNAATNVQCQNYDSVGTGFQWAQSGGVGSFNWLAIGY